MVHHVSLHLSWIPLTITKKGYKVNLLIAFQGATSVTQQKIWSSPSSVTIVGIMKGALATYFQQNLMSYQKLRSTGCCVVVKV